MVEERRAHFQAAGHGHLVDLHEHAVGEHRVELDKLLAGTAFGRCHVGPTLHWREGVGIHRTQPLRVEQMPDLLRVHEVLPADVLSGSREDRPLEEPFQYVACALLAFVIGNALYDGPIERLPERHRQPRECGCGLAGPEAVVSHEDLIPAVAAQANLHVAARFLADEHERQVRRIGRGLVQVPDRPLDGGCIDRGNQQLRVSCTEVIGDLARVFKLTEGALAITERERLQRRER